MKHTVLLLPALLLAACSAPPAGQGSVLDPPGTDVQPSAASPWTAVRPSEGLALLQAPARAIAPPDSRATLTPPFAARVVRVHVRPGDRVAAGAPLLEVVMPEVVDAAGRLAAAQIRLEAQSARREKLASLREVGMVRSADLAEIEAAIGEARAAALASRAVLASAGVQDAAARAIAEGGRITLRSPIEGIVTAVDASIGAVREPGGDPLVEVAGGRAERVAARTSMALPPQASLAFVPAGGAPVPVELVAASPLVDPRDGSREVFFTLPAGAQVSPGSSGVVRATLPPELGAVAVPQQAIALRDGGGVVFVRRGARVEEVPVEVLATGGDDALVRGALRAGDEVAADAASRSAGGES